MRLHLALGLAVLLLAGCADTAYQQASPLSVQPNCCKSFANYQFAEPVLGQSVILRVDGHSPSYEFDGQRSHFVGVKVADPAVRKMDVWSTLTREGIHIPNLVYLNAQYALVGADTKHGDWEQGHYPQGDLFIHKTITLPKGAMYVVAYNTADIRTEGVVFKAPPNIQNTTGQSCTASGGDKGIVCTSYTTQTNMGPVEVTAHAVPTGFLRFALADDEK